MTIRAAKSLGIVWFLFLPADGVIGQELPRTTVQHGAFGFPDLNGGRLLSVSDPSRPEVLHAALCSGGGRFPVTFEHRQSEREGSNERQSPYNFDKLAGSVFTVRQGKIDGSATCFVASDSLLSSATLLSAALQVQSGECGPDVRQRFASSRGRRVVNCWLIGRLPGDRLLALVEFARQGKDALASVAFMDGDRILFADYPAVFRGRGADLWRVDDGGVLSPEGLQVVFLLERGHFHALGVSWSGSEGASLAVFVSHGDDRFTRVIKDYWYRAPI